MRKLALLVAFASVTFAAPAAASPTVRLSILHYVRGCHVWQLNAKTLGPSTTLTLKRGTRLEIRATCPMDFDFTQVAGPRLALGAGRTYAGTTRTITLTKRGVYKLTVQNVQSSEERGLVTLGADNHLTLTIRVT